MRGKPVTLASAGPRLTGPPEGYGRKKELQVKHWLTSAQPATDVGAPDITTEPSLYPNQSLDDVYKQLRDSTDRIPAFFVAKTDPAEPTAAEEKAPNSASGSLASVSGAPSLTQELVAAGNVSAHPTNPAAPATRTTSLQHSTAGTTTVPPASASAVQHVTPPAETAAAESSCQENSISSSSCPPLIAATTPVAAAGAHATTGTQQLLPLSAAAANLCQVLASAEAGKPVVDSTVEVQQLQKEVQQLTLEHQEHVTKASADLAAAYAAVEATKTDAAAEAAKSQQAVAVLQQRIAAAEADAAAARAAGMQAQQEARRLTMEKDDVAAEQLNQMQQMQQQLRTVTQQMCKQNERHEKVVQGLQQQLQDAKQHLIISRRELELTRSQAAVQESSFMAQLQAVKGQVAQLQHQSSTQQQELQQLQQDCQQQQAARQSAEAAEAKALRLAAQRAQMFEALLLEMQHSNSTADRRARASSAGVHSKRAAATQQGNLQANQHTPSIDKQHLQCSKPAAAGSSSKDLSGTPASAEASAAAEFGPVDTAEARAKHRKLLLKGAAADKKALAELAAACRRAEAAAQLEESSKVQQMLSAAPEALRILGLAFRAYVVLPEAQGNNKMAQQVVQELSNEYQLYLDTTTVNSCAEQTAGTAAGRCSPLTSAILGISGALMILLPSDYTANSVADGSNSSSKAHSRCLGLMLDAVRRGLPVMFVGQLDALQKEQALAAAGAAGWSQQEQSTLAGYFSSCMVPYSRLAASETTSTLQQTGPVSQLQQMLGLTDLQLSLLPQSALKKLATAAAGKVGVPDLSALNCQALTHMTLDLSAMTAAAQNVLQQRQQQSVATQNSKEAGSMQQQQQQASDYAEPIVTDLVGMLLMGNKMLKVLKLEGVSSTAAAAVTDAILGATSSRTISSRCSPGRTDQTSCQLSLLGLNGLLIPVSALLAGHATSSISSNSISSNSRLEELDLINGNLSVNAHQPPSRPWTAKAPAVTQQQRPKHMLLSEQQAVFLAVLLPHCSSLKCLQLPMLAADVGDEVAERLADAVLQLSQLRLFNGVRLDGVVAPGAAASGSSSSSLQQQQQEVGNNGLVGSSRSRGQLTIDHAGQQLGAVGAALLARALQHSHAEEVPSVINLAGCDIGPAGAASIAASLAALHRQGFPQSAITSSCSHGLQPPASPRLASLSSLRELHLSGNHIGPTGLSQLLSALAGPNPGSATSLLAQLEVLDISYNNLTSEGCQVLAEYCEGLKGLQVLNLMGNEISAAGVQALFSRQSRTASSNSSVSRTALQGTATSAAGSTECHPLPSLRVLQLGCNVVGDKGVAALAVALPHLKHLQQLEVQENYSIGVEGIRSLAVALEQAPSLIHLNLAKNSIGPQGAKLLAAGLQANAAAAAAAEASTGYESFVGLKHLELEWCKLRTEGIVHIAAALANTTTAGRAATSSALRQSTSCSRVGCSSSSSSKGSGSAIAVHCCLERLGLSRNGAGDKGVQALVEALATNNSLTHLDLRHNTIGLTGCRLLSGLLQGHNSSIRMLQLAGNMENSIEEEAPVLQALEGLAAADRSSLRPTL